MAKLELSLVLPVHNQDTIITPAVKELHKYLSKSKIAFEIILVENGSKDNTLKVLEQIRQKYNNIRVIIAKKGYGSAVIAGLNVAKGEYVSYMPSDGQLDSKLVPRLYKLIKNSKYDLVKIRRTTRESFIRKFRSKVFNYLARLFFTINIKDINGSPRVFLRKWLPVLKLSYKDSFIDTEMAIKTYFLKWKIKEIPTETLPRLGGKSTVNIYTIIEFIRNLIFYKFGRYLTDWKISASSSGYKFF